MNTVNWNERAQILRQAMSIQSPVITMGIVMQVFGFSSKATAEATLRKLEDMGVVRNENGKWYLIKGGR